MEQNDLEQSDRKAYLRQGHWATEVLEHIFQKQRSVCCFSEYIGQKAAHTSLKNGTVKARRGTWITSVHRHGNRYQL